jgi:hypothetical protein
MPLVGRGEQHRRAAVQRQAVELGHLVAAGSALEDKVAAGLGLVAGAADRVGAVGELLALGQRAADPEELRGVGAGLAVADQHLALGRVPVHEAVAAEIGVAGHRVRQGLRHRWNALNDQVGIGRDDRDRRGRTGRQQGRKCREGEGGEQSHGNEKGR